MFAVDRNRNRIGFIVLATVVTLGIHYGWLVEPFFGHVHWIHAVHGRFCYVPIVMAAAWFGLRGGLVAAAAISLLLLPLVISQIQASHDVAVEVAEIVFYFAVGGLVGVLVDRENAARRRQLEAQDQVERSQKLSLVGQIAAGVAHEIKNPLASIKGAADILTDPSTAETERAEFRDILRGEVRRIDATVAEFLEFARPRATRHELVDLHGLVGGTVKQMAPQADRAGVALRFSGEQATVTGDEEKLRQLVLNLLLNAVQATGENGNVSVGIHPRKDTVVLKVVDDGCGIPAEQAEQVFEPFFTTRSSGTGLGLAVARTIVEEHGGTITLAGQPGNGTTVTVSLPVP